MIPVRPLALPPGLQLTIVLLITLAALPHVLHLEILISWFCLVITGLRFLAIRRPALQPGRLILLLVTLAAFGNVFLHYPLLIGREAGVSLLCSMAALKLLEMRSHRDVYVLVFLGYFILGTQFLFMDSTILVLYVLLLVTVLTAVLVSMNRFQTGTGMLQAIKVSGTLLAQAVPIMLVLFVFFPRFTSPLWNLGPESDRAVSGVSGQISPGTISRLSRSPVVAFRVDFEGGIPAPDRRYWRGPVFTETDGKHWIANHPEQTGQGVLATGAAALDYYVTMEPAPGNWLYTLELPSRIPANARLLSDFQLINNGPIRRRIRYAASSILDQRGLSTKGQGLQQALALPSDITPRMRDLVATWQSSSRSPAEIVVNALAYFRGQPFYYTLYPPDPGNNPTDGFLFETRRGFCEHYATSFTLLMRIAGIPARVVGGYQGGEINPIGNYLIVRQSDAHAWSEVWLEERGWTRIDPTAAVAPERIERPLDTDQEESLIGAPAIFQGLSGSLPARIQKRIELGLDALNAAWYRWVLGYSKERQSKLMSRIGLGFLYGTRLAYAMVFGAGILVLLMAGLARRGSRRRNDPVVEAYRRFCQRLGRRGLRRLAHEGPQDYAARVARDRPDLAAEVAGITRLYIGIRYGRHGDRESRRRLTRLVQAFRP